MTNDDRFEPTGFEPRDFEPETADAPAGIETTLKDPPARLGGTRRVLLSLGLVAGLLAIGGASAVLAASPDPSASSPPATQNGSNGGSGGTTAPRHNCPADQGGSGGQTTPDATGSSSAQT